MSTRLKTCLFSAIAAAFALTCVFGAGSATAQAEAAPQPTRVGLIDMAQVFRDYWKFANLREDLKNEMIAMDTAAKPKMEELNAISQKIKSNAFAQGSAERDAAEKKLFELSSELEALRKKAQVDVMRKESEIYKDIYLEVQALVAKYSAYKKYDIVIRFNSNPLEETQNPQAVLQQMNRQIVHHDKDNDITLAIVKYLNSDYEKKGGTKPATAAGK